MKFELNDFYTMTAAKVDYAGVVILRIGFMAKKNDNRYLPTIYFDDDWQNNKLNPTASDFSIQTTSYGALKSDELVLFMDAMNIAYETVQGLTDFDWDGLEVVKGR